MAPGAEVNIVSRIGTRVRACHHRDRGFGDRFFVTPLRLKCCLLIPRIASGQETLENGLFPQKRNNLAFDLFLSRHVFLESQSDC